jgi:hypothetical protein
MICAASIPAFFAAFSATVATGTPLGIWRIDRTESHPSIELEDFTGTPITGKCRKGSYHSWQMRGTACTGNDHL